MRHAFVAEHRQDRGKHDQGFGSTREGVLLQTVVDGPAHPAVHVCKFAVDAFQEGQSLLSALVVKRAVNGVAHEREAPCQRRGRLISMHDLLL